MDIFSGLTWRHVPRGAHALHVGWILRASGRWNRQGVYGALYTALTASGALAEYRRYITRSRVPTDKSPRDLVSVRVHRVGPVLDLTEEPDEVIVPVAPAALVGDASDDLETCRAIADWARSEGYQALLVPSAALSGAQNLVIYVDGPATNVDIDEGPDRTPIDPNSLF